MNIIIAGVGGQGTILASKILAAAALKSGFSPMTGETIGMSQRGGCVTSHVRTDKAASPYIPMGEADLLLGFELCESARNIPALKSGGKAVVNLKRINPVTVSLKKAEYDGEKMKEYISENSDCVFTDALTIAEECGSAKTINIVLIGVALGMGFFNMDIQSIKSAIEKNVPPKFLEMNIRAFEAGIKAGREELKNEK